MRLDRPRENRTTPPREPQSSGDLDQRYDPSAASNDSPSSELENPIARLPRLRK